MKNLKGTLSNTFGGFPTIRGTATFNDIVEISEPKDYQRNTIPDHLLEIEDFYDRGEAVFFPEVILSLELKYDFNAEMAESLNGDPVNHILNGAKFKSNIDQLQVSSNKSGMATVSIPNGVRPLGRIDGNHRLSVTNAGHFLTEEIPFCIVLFNSDVIDRNEKSLFFNINSKGRPLTNEETLRAIIEDEENFPASELQQNPSFGWEYFLAREIKKSLRYAYIPSLEPIIKPSELTFLVNTINFLFQKEVLSESESCVETLIGLLSNAHNLFENTELTRTRSAGLLSAFIYYQLTSPKSVSLFKNWAIKNHMFELEEMGVSSFVGIFDKIAEAKKKQIFISMQFSPETEQNYRAIQDAVREIEEEHGETLGLKELRIDHFKTGFSYNINDTILSLIEGCGLFIADLSMGNKNVYHEIGYLMGLNKGQGYKQENFILFHNSAMGDCSNDIGFNLAPTQQLRVNDTNSLRAELKKQIKIYYGLDYGV